MQRMDEKNGREEGRGGGELLSGERGGLGGGKEKRGRRIT